MRLTTVFTQRAPLHTVLTARGARLDVTPGAALVSVTQVTTGLTGAPGSGVPGATGDRHHTHDQGTAAAEWLIAHGLGKCPAVTVVDSAGDQVEGDVDYIDLNTLTVFFSAPFAGRAYLN